MLNLDPFSVTEEFGYSCQTWLSKLVNKFLYGNRNYCWFSTNVNPIENGDSSNPLSIYATLDRAVKKNDRNHSKIKDVQTNLMRAVKKMLISQGRNREVAQAIKSIRMADEAYYRPQMWRIRLQPIDRTRYGGVYQYPDEFLIRDLRDSEYETIVE